MKFIYEEKLDQIFLMTIANLFVEYAMFLIVKYFRQKLHGELS